MHPHSPMMSGQSGALLVLSVLSIYVHRKGSMKALMWPCLLLSGLMLGVNGLRNFGGLVDCGVGSSSEFVSIQSY